MTELTEEDKNWIDSAISCAQRRKKAPEPPEPPIFLPSPLSQSEATTYYRGLPSEPILVARTSTNKSHSTSDDGTNAAPLLKELRPLGAHPLRDIWEDNAAFNIHLVLDDGNIDWTSTDVVRIRENLEQGDGSVVLWIGVKPASLDGYHGLDIAFKCRSVLLGYGIDDVQVEIRESAVTRWGEPRFQFLPLLDPFDKFAHLRTRLTSTLGLPIYPKEADTLSGTGGLFLSADGHDGRILLLTARHVVWPLDKGQPNKFYERTKPAQPKHGIGLISTRSWMYTHLDELRCALGRQGLVLKSVENRVNSSSDLERRSLQAELAKVQAETKELISVYEELVKYGSPRDRLFGHIILSPPLKYGSGDEGYSSDWAVIEINPGVVHSGNFYGNVIDLSIGQYSEAQLAEKLGPDFVYPKDHLFRLKGTLSKADLHPGGTQEDLIVMKHGGGTGLTIGRANDVCSYARSTYLPSNVDSDWVETQSLSKEPGLSHDVSKEWAILPYDAASGSFAHKGDSGSVVVDAKGRIGGMITGGTGTTRITGNSWGRVGPTPFTSDITYSTPMHILLGQMQRAGLKGVCLDPKLS